MFQHESEWQQSFRSRTLISPVTMGQTWRLNCSFFLYVRPTCTLTHAVYRHRWPNDTEILFLYLSQRKEVRGDISICLCLIRWFIFDITMVDIQLCCLKKSFISLISLVKAVIVTIKHHLRCLPELRLLHRVVHWLCSCSQTRKKQAQTEGSVHQRWTQFTMDFSRRRFNFIIRFCMNI